MADGQEARRLSRIEPQWIVLIIAVVAALLLVWRGAFPGVGLSDPTIQDVVGALTPLFLYALFVERALEVFIAAWRSVPEHRESPEYKVKTKQYALIGGFALGLLLSVTGVRALETFLVENPQWSPGQQNWFNTVDVLVTGALLGGGADGLHRIVTIFTDFADVTRGRVNRLGGGSTPGTQTAGTQTGDTATDGKDGDDAGSGSTA